METAIKIPLSKKEKERLDRLAISYGLSLSEFSGHVLKELSANIPEESFSDYTKPKDLKKSFKKALQDYKNGKVRQEL